MTEPPRRVHAIDLNADIGEADDPAGRAREDAIIAIVSSVNIACGGHAGDESSMRHALRVAAQHGVAAGAHPSYPDRTNFGRTRLAIEPAALRDALAEQIASLASLARSEGIPLTHCKPHGALYHAASSDESIAEAIRHACHDHDPGIRLVGQAGSRAVEWWQQKAATVAEEAFADRVYESDGSLRSRTQPGALITDPETAGEQAVRLATSQRVLGPNGETIPIKADTICLHSDTPNAENIAAHVAAALRSAGVIIRSPE
jgi:UPF0271 protein